MLQLIYGQDDLIVPWICNQLQIINPHPCVTIGVASENRVIAAALYNNLQLDTVKKPLSIEISFATIDKHWANRAIISALLGYPFCQLKAKRVQSTVWKKNRNVRQFLERLGFKLEGVGRQAWPHGGDACLYSMLSRDYFTGKWKPHGKISASSASSARSSSYNSGSNCIQ